MDYGPGREHTGVRRCRPGMLGAIPRRRPPALICQAGYQSSSVHREPIGANGAQAEYLRVPLADRTLVATPGIPDGDLIPSLLTASDVPGTGWFGAEVAEAGPGKTVAVVGDGAVGLLTVPAAGQLRRWRRADQGTHRRARRALVIEAVGTQESMMQAIRSPVPAATSATLASPTGRAARPGAVLLPRAPARRPRTSAPGNGRAPRHQGPAASVDARSRPAASADRPTSPHRIMRPIRRGVCHAQGLSACSRSVTSSSLAASFSSVAASI